MTTPKKKPAPKSKTLALVGAGEAVTVTPEEVTTLQAQFDGAREYLLANASADAHPADAAQLAIDQVPPPAPPVRAPSATLAPVIEVDLVDIDESPLNYRRVFKGIEALAENIKAEGLEHPPTVRPHPHEPGRYELVHGARRFRACRLADLTRIQVKVRELTDAQVRASQLSENIQRESTHPIEEAEAFDAMIRQDGYTNATLAEYLGRSVEFVQKRRKLLEMEAEVREAFVNDLLDASVALVIARMPNRDMQLQALKDLGAKEVDGARASLREAQKYARDMMLRIVDAKFDTTDATLLPRAGACTACPKNTQSSTPLFAEIEDTDGLCTDRKCWEAKNEANFERVAQAAEKADSGTTVLAKGEASKTFLNYGTFGTRHGSEWVSLDDEGGRVDRYDTKKTVGKLLGKKLDDMPKTIAQNPHTGEVHTLVPAKLAIAALRPEEAEPSDKAKKAAERQAARDKAEREREKAKEAAAAKAIASAIERKPPSWRTLARLIAADGFGINDGLFDAAHSLHGVDLDAEMKGLADAKVVDVWEEKTKHLTEGQFAALVTLAVAPGYRESSRAELERAWPSLKAGVAKAEAAAVEKTKAKAKDKSAALRKGGKAKASKGAPKKGKAKR